MSERRVDARITVSSAGGEHSLQETPVSHLRWEMSVKRVTLACG